MDKHIKPGLPSFYSLEQVQEYLRRTNFHGDSSPFLPNLRNLEQLMKLHLLAFPFENSPFHYTPTHEVDVAPQFVYDRLVKQRLGGSWCCGQNGLFLGVLRGLGYRVIAVAGRVNQSPPSEEPRDYTFLSHMALLVQLDEEEPLNTTVADSKAEQPRRRTYLVDVGFGGTGIVRPMLLVIGQTIAGSAPPEEHRIVQRMHPESSFYESESSREWALQYRCGSHQPGWATLYIFGEVEMYPNDWMAYSQWLCAHPVELFVHNVFCVRHFILENEATQDDGSDVRLGRLVMMGKRVQRRVGAQSETIREFSTESERVSVLKEDFGIIVEESEIQNIANTPAALLM